jgi:hypothetical protein
MAKHGSSATKTLLTALLLSPVLIGCGNAELANDQTIGHPCDLTFTSPMQYTAYNAGAAECPSHICLKPVQLQEPSDPPTGATCSGECTQDSDCEGELRDPNDPSDTRCQSGFTCAMPFEVGPLACRKLCVCKDFGTGDTSIPYACQGRTTPPLTSDVAGIGEIESVYISTPPLRTVDMVVLVDNSPTMGPKIAKFTTAFPKMLEVMRGPEDGMLPNLRITILDSDLGTGGAYPSGPCGPRVTPDGNISVLGDMGRFQMLSSPVACALNPGSLFLEHKLGAPLNYSGDISDVLSCSMGNLGTSGCDQTQPLQAFELGLATKGFGNETQQAAFLRPEARLALIFLTDKDDCSAFPDDGLFGDKPELAGESRRLRCATRAHACGGQNLSDGTPGYPTGSSYTHAFSDCRARKDACPNALDMVTGTDTSETRTCSPLRDITDMARTILALKAEPSQIAVAGFFGWPLDGDGASAQYKIAPVPNPDASDTEHPTVFDAWPVCYDPNHLPSPATTDPTTGFDATAAAWGATPGLREAAFIDEITFGNYADGAKFSVCQPDFSKSMESIGAIFAAKIQNLCVDNKLVDGDIAAPGLQPSCRIAYRKPILSPADNTVTYVDQPSLPRCAPDATSDNIIEDCWQLTVDKARCPVNGQRVKILRTAADLALGPLPNGTKIKVACEICPAMNAGFAAAPGCDY